MSLLPTRVLLRAVGLAALLVPACALSATPSFLCSKGKTWVEKTICGSERLSELYLELATVYARLLRVTAGAAENSRCRSRS